MPACFLKQRRDGPGVNCGAFLKMNFRRRAARCAAPSLATKPGTPSETTARAARKGLRRRRVDVRGGGLLAKDMGWVSLFSWTYPPEETPQMPRSRGMRAAHSEDRGPARSAHHAPGGGRGDAAAAPRK